MSWDPKSKLPSLGQREPAPLAAPPSKLEKTEPRSSLADAPPPGARDGVEIGGRPLSAELTALARQLGEPASEGQTPEQKALLAEIAVRGAALVQGTSAARRAPEVAAAAALLRNDPALKTAAMHATIEAAFPPGTPREEIEAMKAEFDKLRAEAATARPIELAGRLVNGAEALKSLLGVLRGIAIERQNAPAAAAAARPEPAATERAPASNPAVPKGAVPPPGEKSPTDKTELRKKIEEACRKNHDDTFAALAMDKAALAQMTPAEKAQAIRRLMSGHTTDKEDRAILNILQSCTSRAEFDEVIKQGGGGYQILKELDEGNAKAKAAMLFQMWDRTDCIPSKLHSVAARAPRGALLDPDGAGMAARGSDPASIDARHGSGSDDMNGVESRSFDRHLYGELDHHTKVELMMENAQRKHAGKPPLDHNKMQAEMRAIMDDKSLDEKGRAAKIENLRKEYGLSPDTMRELGTRRMAEVTSAVKQDLAPVYIKLITQLEAEYERVAAKEGKDSPAAQAIARRLKEVAADAEQRLGRLQSAESELGKLYPVPPGFWERLGDTVGKVAKMALKVLDVVMPFVALIPGVGTAIFAAYSGARALMCALQGDWKGALMHGISMAGPLGRMIGGPAGAALRTGGMVAKGVMSGVEGAQAFARGDYAGGILGMAGGLSTAGSALGMSGKVLDTINKGARIGAGVANTIEGIRTGNWERTLGGLAMAGGEIPGASDAAKRALDNPIVKKVMEQSKRGAEFLQNLREGKLAAAAAILDDEIGKLAEGTELGRVYAEAKRKTGELVGDARARAEELAGPLRGVYRHGERGYEIYQAARNGDARAVLAGFEAEASALGLGDAMKDIMGRAETLLARPEVAELVRGYEEAAPFVAAVVSGEYRAALERVYEMEELAELRGNIDEVRAILGDLETTFRTVAGEVIEDVRTATTALPPLPPPPLPRLELMPA